MASYLKPRRGTASNSSSIVLKSGEIFFEIGNSGTPTTGSNAKAFGKIKMGDGSSAYSNLGYFIDVDTTAIDWTDSTSTATSADQGADNYQDLNSITPTATLKSILASIKNLLFNHSTQITTINSNLTATSGSVTWNTGNVSGDPTRKTWYKMGKLVIASLEWTPLSGKIANNYVICAGLPIPNASGMYMNGGNTQQVKVSGDGELMYHFPTDTATLNRIDMTIVYFTS